MVKSPPASAGDTGDTGSIFGSGRSPEEGNGSPLQYSCLGNPMDREAWRASWGRKELDIAEGQTHTLCFFLMPVAWILYYGCICRLAIPHLVPFSVFMSNHEI